MRTSRSLLACVAVLLVVAAGSAAYAAIPGGGGVISGCYDKQSGNLRVTDAATGQPKGCTTKEAPLSWNQQGPKGVSRAFYASTAKLITQTAPAYPAGVIAEKELGPGTYMLSADLNVNGYGNVVPLEVVKCSLSGHYQSPSGSGGSYDYGSATVMAGAGGDTLSGSIALSERLTVPAGGTGKAYIVCWAPSPAYADDVDLWALELDSIN